MSDEIIRLKDVISYMRFALENAKEDLIELGCMKNGYTMGAVDNGIAFSASVLDKSEYYNGIETEIKPTSADNLKRLIPVVELLIKNNPFQGDQNEEKWGNATAILKELISS